MPPNLKPYLIFSVSHPDGVKTELMGYYDSISDAINQQMCLVTSFPAHMVFSLAGEAAIREWIADRMIEVAEAIRHSQFPPAPRIEPKRIGSDAA